MASGTTTTGRLGPAVALFAGALAFPLLRVLAGLPFAITPLVVGLTAAAATLAAPAARRSWTVPALLVGWGLAVVLSREGPLPAEREGAASLVGIGLGLLAGALATPAARRTEALRGTALALVGGGVLFFLAFDLAQLRSWWAWSLGLAAAGLVELRRA